MFRDLWTYNRRLVVIVIGVVVTLLAVVTLLVTAHGKTRASAASTAPTVGAPTPSAGVTAGESGSTVAKPTTASQSEQAAAGLAQSIALFTMRAPVVRPAVSRAFPALSTVDTSQRDVFASAFTKELFTVNYHHAPRASALSWAQYQSAPLPVPSVNGQPVIPLNLASRSLVYTLTDPSATQVNTPALPTEGRWAALAAEHGTSTITAIRTTQDQVWEDQVASGGSAPDALETVVDVSASVTTSITVGRTVSVQHEAVAFQLRLGTGSHGGYGASALQGFVVKVVA